MDVFVSAVLVGGGASSRMGRDKLSIEIGGRSVLRRSMEALDACEDVQEIILVTRPGSEEDRMRDAAAWGIRKLVRSVPGGQTRAESVMNGVRAASEATTHLCIHDAARPFATPELISRVIADAVRYGAAAPVIPMVDTVKQVDGEGRICSTPDRSKLYRVQTPQVFDAELYRKCAEGSRLSGAFDDCQILESAGYTVYPTPGDQANIKITTPEDISMDTPVIRIGQGYDVHRLAANRKLILCGVEIPYEKGLDGHSDADVAVHALMDAILGAAALGDIGKLFPPDDPAYEGADSIGLLKEVIRTVGQEGFTVGNADITIIAQRPKMRTHIEKMRENLAAAMQIPVECVSVKATTEEGLGFTGSGEGISAQAAVLLTK